MCAAALAGDVATARARNDRLLPLHRRLFVEANPIPVKWALAEMGLIHNELRLPLVPLSPQFHETVRAALREAGVSRDPKVPRMHVDATVRLAARRVLAVAVPAVVLVVLAGCESSPASPRQAHRLQVGGAARRRSRCRPTSRRPRYDDRYKVTTAIGPRRAQRRHGPALGDPADQSPTRRSCARATSAGCVVKATPEQAWNTSRAVLARTSGFVLAIEQPRLGVMETDWAENRAEIPQRLPPRSTIGKYVDIFYSTYKRDKFRTRIERGAEPGTVEIYISHRGMEQVPTGKIDNSSPAAFAWAVMPPNPGARSRDADAPDDAVRHARSAGERRRCARRRRRRPRRSARASTRAPTARRSSSSTTVRPRVAARRPGARPHRLHRRRPRPLATASTSSATAIPTRRGEGSDAGWLDKLMFWKTDEKDKPEQYQIMVAAGRAAQRGHRAGPGRRARPQRRPARRSSRCSRTS